VNLRQSPRGLATGKHGGSFSKKGRHVAALELQIAFRIDAVNLENRLRDIETDCRDYKRPLPWHSQYRRRSPPQHQYKVHRSNLCCHLGYTGTSAISAHSKLKNEGASIRLQHLRRAACDPRLALIFWADLLRTKEKYIRAKAASNTPPNIKIKVVTICSAISISKKSLIGVQRLICPVSNASGKFNAAEN
jgi:hypothetical protein